MEVIKITVLGKGVVGKGELISKFINYKQTQEHDPTNEDRYKTNLNINGKDYELEILDTAGEEDYQNMMDMWLSFGDGFLIVFAINDKESFELTKGKRDRIIKFKHGVKCPIILVGNKNELENEREVSYVEAKSLADSWGIPYFETSVINNYNVKNVFEQLAKDIIKVKTKVIEKKCIIS